jgi:hypothetical protein
MEVKMNKLKRNSFINKRTAGLASLLLVMVGLALHFSGVLPLTPDSFVITIPGNAAAEAAEVVLAPIILFYVAIFLVLVFSGVGVIVVGSLLLVGVVLLLMAIPFMLPLLIPVFIIWISIVIARRRKTAMNIS